jgi:hypothetical protein
MALATVHQTHNGWAHCCPLSTSLCNHTSSPESPRFTCLWYTAFKTNLGLQKKNCRKEWLIPVLLIKLSTDVDEELTMEAMLGSASTPG